MKQRFIATMLLIASGLRATTWETEPGAKTLVTRAENGCEAWVGGLNHDIFAIKCGGKLVRYDPIADSSQPEGISAEDVVVGKGFIAVRYGKRRDLVRLYGISRARTGGWTLQVLDYPQRDGEFRLTSGGDELLATLGARHDWNRKLCWNGKWSTSIQTHQGYAACTIPVPPLGKGPAIGDRPEGPRLIAVN